MLNSLNPCVEIPLHDGFGYSDGDFEVCQIATVGFEHLHVDHPFSILDGFAKKTWKTKRKNKKLWRSIDENWTPTKSELT